MKGHPTAIHGGVGVRSRRSSALLALSLLVVLPAQHLELAAGRPLADGGRHQALLATADRGTQAVLVRLTSVNGGLPGT